MKKLQGNAAAKACAWVLLLSAAFGAGVFGVRALLSSVSVTRSSWQNTSRFYGAIDGRREELIQGIELSQTLERLEQQIEEGTGSPLAYADVEALREEKAQVEERFSRQNTWFRFRLLTDDGQTLLGTNLKDDEAISRAVKEMHYFSFELWEGGVYGNGHYYDPETAGLNPDAEAAPLKLVLEYGVPEKVDDSIQDEFSQMWRLWDMDRASFDQYLTGFLSLGALTLLALIWILWTAGHKSGAEEIVLTWQDRIFFDVYAVVMIAAIVFLAFCTVGLVEQLYWSSASVYTAQSESYTSFYNLGVIGAGALFAAGVGCAALLLRTLTVRVKARCLGKTTLLCRVAAWMAGTIHDFVRFLPFTWKIVLGFGSYVMVTFFLIMEGVYNGAFMFIDRKSVV